MRDDVRRVFQQAELYSDGVEYIVLKLHPRAITLGAGILAEHGNPFSVMIVDKDEVSLVIAADLVTEFESRLRDYSQTENTYRLITLDLKLDFSLIGLMAELSDALANAGISILAFGAYSRDHLLVPSDRFDDAMTVLNNLKQQATSE